MIGPRSDRRPGPLRLVVLADSTAFTDEHGPQLPDVAHLYPNVAARALAADLGEEVEVIVLARAGMTVREAWRTLSKDRHAQFDVLANADLVVVGVGSFDHAPGGLPPVLDAITPYVRPARARDAWRRGLHAAYPRIVALTNGRLRRTPAKEFQRLFDLVLQQVSGLVRGAPGVVLGPTSHRSDYYGQRHPGHAAATSLHFAVAASHGYAVLPTWPLVEPLAGSLNVDGIHWPAAAHARVGAAVAEELAAQWRGARPRPPDPWARWRTPG